MPSPTGARSITGKCEWSEPRSNRARSAGSGWRH